MIFYQSRHGRFYLHLFLQQSVCIVARTRTVLWMELTQPRPQLTHLLTVNLCLTEHGALTQKEWELHSLSLTVPEQGAAWFIQSRHFF